ncbi:MAG: 1,6-anhydro-N-acetylmuramyl-L-alanine amidase AmpD [Burkholderiaceae bacterium]|nr:MAG: 1,6-anhydro-N-acetylmuramyl-L-alanine amidase AmpD [Burkholderiaceae bacterium]
MTGPTTAVGNWDAGWYASARVLASPNCDARPVAGDVSLIVVHSISLPPGEFGGDEVPALFTNTLDWDAHPYFQSIRGLRVSPHFFIRRDGSLWQFASCDARAWHAGVSMFGNRSQCNDFSVGIELEGLEGERFERVQYDTLVALCRAIATHYPIKAIAGHEHIAPGRKHDPGPGFDWRLVQQALGWPDDRFPPHAFAAA